MIFSFEGLDASGKNTQSKRLHQHLLESKKSDVEYLSFPDYTTKIGEEIHAFLTGKREYGIEARHLLYSVNRYEHLDQIRSWNSQKKIVIVNRYSDSNIAYGVASGLSMEWLRSLESRMPQPEYVFWLKIDPKISSARKPRGDRFESDLKYLQRVSSVYAVLAESSNWIAVDGDRPIETVGREISKLADALLQESTMPA